MKIEGWSMHAVGEDLRSGSYERNPAAGQVLVRVAGCGVCHTDLGFLFDGVPTRHPLPLVLGHEIAGTVIEAGPDVEEWTGRDVVVPAVIPCGGCETCLSGHGPICPHQIFPGNDLDGGFASHLVVPATGLCQVPNLADAESNPAGLGLATLSVIADAVSTPYQALLRTGLTTGDLAVFVGVGGVGGFGVQIAKTMGARVVALDVDAERLRRMESYGADLGLDVSNLGFKELRRGVREFAKGHGVATYRQKIFECSGTPAGQATAFGLLGHGGYLGVVGYTPRKVEIRLSNLMALDATAQGNWGCLPEHYPAVVELALQGKIALDPFVETRPLATINQTLREIHKHGASRRVILQPES